MILSKQGINLIKSFEGLRLNAYKDAAGIWTIGYGSTRYEDDKPVKQGDKLKNEEQASALFIKTLTIYESAVNKFIHVPLSQNRFDALVSITYNVGVGIMQRSTLANMLNQKDYAAAADQFLLWDKITDPCTHKKITNNTLSRRRQQERETFLTPYDHDTQKG